MAGVSIRIDITGFEGALRALRPILEFEPGELMSTLGALGESQTRRRISEEKTAPDGTAWAPNLTGTPILVESGQHLLYSIAWSANAEEAMWGASWEHADVHQFGMTIKAQSAAALRFKVGDRWVRKAEVTIPARPFLGISSENAQEILDVVSDHFGMMQ